MWSHKICILFISLTITIGGAVTTNCSDNGTGPEPIQNDWPFDPPSTEPLDAFAMNEKIGRGLNLGNALEASSEGEWGMVIKDKYLKIIANAGFNSIRLPISWYHHSTSDSTHTIDEIFFKRVDHVVQEALKNDLVVVMNNHHFDPLDENPEQYWDWQLALWRQIADRYKKYPDELIFEVLNEPHGNFNIDNWNRLADECIDIIRETNPYRIIVIGGIHYNNYDYLDDLELPEDDRGIIGTFHYYDPFHFTHQGAGWVGGNADEWLGTTWRATKEQRQDVKEDLDIAAEWSATTNRPVLLGEFGAYSKADMNSRYLWTDYVARSAEERGFSWTYWEFGAGFGAYDRDNNEWRTMLLKALNPDAVED